MCEMPTEGRDRPSLSFLARFVGLLIVFYFLVAWRPINDAVIVPFTAGIALVSGAILNMFGEQVAVSGTEIRAPTFAVNIENGCNGIETVLLFGAAVLAFPASAPRRALGFAVGFLSIQTLNLLRVVSLFWVGEHHPAFFFSSHTVVWQSVVVLFGVLLFLAWALWRRPAGRPAPVRSTGRKG